MATTIIKSRFKDGWYINTKFVLLSNWCKVKGYKEHKFTSQEIKDFNQHQANIINNIEVTHFEIVKP